MEAFVVQVEGVRAIDLMNDAIVTSYEGLAGCDVRSISQEY